MRIDLVGTTADFGASGPPSPLPVNHLLRENCRMEGRIGEVGLDDPGPDRLFRTLRLHRDRPRARLCAAAQDGQILVSSRIAGAVEAVVRLEDLGIWS